MEDLSLHILDVAENSVAAGARRIEIAITEDVSRDLLTIEIVDDGKGMGSDEVEKAADPFYTSRTTRRVGLGLALLDEAARMANGELSVQSAVGHGTKVTASFQRSHVDRKPMGSMAETLVSLFMMYPETEIEYRHRKNGKEFSFDTKELKRQLGVDTLRDSKLLNELKEIINGKLKELL